MQKPYKPLSFDKVQTYPLSSRRSKVHVSKHFANQPQAGCSLHEFINNLPPLLGAKALSCVIDAVVSAHINKRPVVLAIGGHVIKCGLQPVISKLIESGVISAVAMNGSVVIHDYEISLAGATSEDVGAVLQSGTFGFSKETGQGINRLLAQGQAKGIGFGETIGKAIIDNKHPYRHYSLLAACVKQNIPATVHVAIGTDIIHQHPEADGAVIGEMSMRDFRLLTSVVADLNDGGVWLNVGSAVLLPEVFLKALSVAQNLGYRVDHFTTANFDMIQHYRPLQNVVKRPTSGQGKGYTITGHHEINIPLLAYAVLDRLSEEREP